MNHYDEETVEQAIQTVAATPFKPIIVDDVYPWYATFKLPLTLISVALLLAAFSGLILGYGLLKSTTQNLEEESRRDCRDTYTSDITSTGRAADAARDTLIVAIAGDDPLAVTSAVEGLAEANVTATAAIEARDAWDASGRPMPCPVEPTVPD
jgi:hypothetical protein